MQQSGAYLLRPAVTSTNISGEIGITGHRRQDDGASSASMPVTPCVPVAYT
ncbi:MAG TPA: hypothetical protein VFU63_01810 [Ktedonobacterales bacterium]|nr:hypothetical protein [Ktedonobacterales bacterium]